MSLVTELQKPEYEGLSNEQASAWLNDDSGNTLLEPIRWAELSIYLLAQSLMDDIEAGTVSGVEGKHICKTILARVTYNPESILDLPDPGVQALLDVLVADAAIPAFTATRKAEVLALGERALTRAQDRLGVNRVTTGEVQAARAQI